MLFTAGGSQGVAEALSHFSGAQRLQASGERLACQGIHGAVPLEPTCTHRRSGKRQHRRRWGLSHRKAGEQTQIGEAPVFLPRGRQGRTGQGFATTLLHLLQLAVGSWKPSEPALQPGCLAGRGYRQAHAHQATSAARAANS